MPRAKKKAEDGSAILSFEDRIGKPDERKALAEEVCRIAEASDTQQGDIHERWKLNEQYYNSVPVPSGTEIMGIVRPMNIVKSRVIQVVANVAGPMFSVEPYYAARGFGQKGIYAKPCEKNVHFFLQRAQFDRRVKKAVKRAALTPPAVFRVHFEDGSRKPGEDSDTGIYVGPVITVLHPKNCILYPLYTGRIQDATFVGDRIWMRCQDIEEDIKRQVFFEPVSKIVGGDDPQEKQVGRTKEHSKTNESDSIFDQQSQAVEVIQGIWKKDLNGDGFEELYWVKVARTQMELLECQPYGVMTQMDDVQVDPSTGEEVTITGQPEFKSYSRPGYFELNLEEPDDEEFIQAGCIAQDLQGPQMVVNEAFGLYLDGTLATAMPAGFTNSPTMPDALIKYKPGELHHVENAININWVRPEFDGANIPGILEFVLKHCDSLVRMSQAGLGQESQGDTTATEYEGILQGQQVGVDDTRMTVANYLAPMIDFIREMLFLNWETVLLHYRDEIPVPHMECMEFGFTWEPMVKGSANTPQAVTMQIQAVLQFLGQLGIPLTPEVVMELLNIFLGSVDLPTDQEALKQAVMGAYQQALEQQAAAAQQAQDEQDEDEGINEGIKDELANRGSRSGGVGVPGNGPPAPTRPPSPLDQIRPPLRL